MATFSAQTFQNEFISDGSDEVHAIVTVNCSDAGRAGVGGEVAEVLIIDASGSMESPPTKIAAARKAGVAAIDEIPDGVFFGVIAGRTQPQMIYPFATQMVRMDATQRANAQEAIRNLRPDGATPLGTWLMAARGLFSTAPTATQRHAILLTDGRIEGEDPSVLGMALQNCIGMFQCDCRGIGADWEVDQLRTISSALLGTVDIVADPNDLAEDFREMMSTSMSRGVADVRLRVWAPQGSELVFLRQVAPLVEDLTLRGTAMSPLIREFPTGGWSDESRDYHIAVKVPPAPVGSERLSARIEVVVDDQVMSKSLVRAVWSGDAALTTRIDSAVAHYTGQADLADAIQKGLAAKASGDVEGATVLLGRATKIATETNNEATMRLLRKVVDVDNADAGTVRLKRDIEKADEMALDTRSTKTVRIGRTPPVAPTPNAPAGGY
jgi:von Willebrand factor type A C-terminal domain/von Willebrand factor type A domain